MSPTPQPGEGITLLSLSESNLEPRIKIGDDILDILDPDGNTDEIRSDTRGKLFLRSQLRVGC